MIIAVLKIVGRLIEGVHACLMEFSVKIQCTRFKKRHIKKEKKSGRNATILLITKPVDSVVY